MRRLLLAAVLALAAPAAATALPGHGGVPEMVPYAEGPDVPPQSAPDAAVTVMKDAEFFFAEKKAVLYRTVRMRVPRPPAGAAGWDRIVLEFTDRPEDDPWDRVFYVAAGKVELLRGTTPRADMTLRKDVTEYAAALRPGQVVPIDVHVGTYVGKQRVTVRLEFYAGERQVHAPARAVHAALTGHGLEVKEGNKAAHRARVAFPKGAPPAGAVVEMTTSGHLQGGEFWYLPDRGSTTPPVFEIRVDGTLVATARAMPYVYALVGFEGANDSVHPLLWWTAHRALDQAGVHTGVGEIPPYRATLTAAAAKLLTGTRTVEVTVSGKGLWITSVSFLFR